MLLSACATLSLLAISCGSASGTAPEFFGRVEPPPGQVLRYISGPEPESLDPQLSTGQSEARIYLALYEGLVEYHPVTLQPIPAIAEAWDVNGDASEYVFHLRRNARWTNGEFITAHDFVYSLRRGLSPELAARSANMAYYVKYAKGYNQQGAFVRDPQTKEFLLESGVSEKTIASAPGVSADQRSTIGAETAFHRFISAPLRLTVPSDAEAREKAINQNPKLKQLLDGKEFVPVAAEDIGIEAIDDHTLRITLTQPAAFFLSMMGHQFFRAVPRKTIEQHGIRWTQVENIVTSGPFRLQSWKPYDELVVVKNPLYWDAASVRLDKIYFYPLDDSTAMLNLYKAGKVDATFNHTVPIGWIDSFRSFKDYMDAPESAITYAMVNTKKFPLNDVRVRRAFNLAIDKRALADRQRTVKPLYAFSPEGIFINYPQPQGDGFDPQRARALLAEAGYRDDSGNYDATQFPVGEVEYTYNAQETNQKVAEFLQAQWTQNLGITVGLKNMEWKTFLSYRSRGEYKGFARVTWNSDYMDPFSFLNIFSAPTGDNGTGWWDAKYVRMLDAANRSADPRERYALLARAEAYMLDAQPVIPLYTNSTNFVKKPYVKGLHPNPMALHPWKFVYIEPDPAKWDRGMPMATSSD